MNGSFHLKFDFLVLVLLNSFIIITGHWTGIKQVHFEKINYIQQKCL